MRSPIYWHPKIYSWTIRGLYGRFFEERYQRIAVEIDPGMSVVDLCCGDGYLFYRYLKNKGVRYIGLDCNPIFVNQLRRDNVDARASDISRDAIPPAEVVVMQASLYHFLPDCPEVMRRIVAAASVKCIVAEPVRNLSSDSNALLQWLGKTLSRTDVNRGTNRFNQETFCRLAEEFGFNRLESIAGGKEILAVRDAGDKG